VTTSRVLEAPRDLKDWLHTLPRERRRIHAGDVLFHCGDPGEAAQLVLNGLVGLEIAGRHREPVITQVYRAGDLVAAERLLLPNSRHEGTARALLATEVQLIHWTDLRRAGIESQVLTELVQAVARQTAAFMQRIAEATHLPATARVAAALCRLADADNVVSVNQDVVAAVAGVVRVTANAELRRLADRRLVSLQRRRIALLDRVALERMAR